MKKLIFTVLFGISFLIGFGQDATIDLSSTNTEELTELRKQVYGKYATGKQAGKAMSKNDEQLINKINDAIAKNPRVNQTFAFSKVPQEYNYEALLMSWNRLSQFFELRVEYQKFKKQLKVLYQNDSTILNRLQQETRVGKERFRGIVTEKD
ncbi:hypothetical protein VB796_21085 [Arcicella sp. LKC2W]|uniref:hypothetical protein n=1 Tax=Arcicella sp. LKC2W TaxID=2984198 RepID=UPI002B20D8DE|nr:hypothetical protein [Arcicella sp. LKC2W]MEA5461575.1 hypothetical protein [Arcicella sp. LKC2W]